MPRLPVAVLRCYGAAVLRCYGARSAAALPAPRRHRLRVPSPKWLILALSESGAMTVTHCGPSRDAYVTPGTLYSDAAVSVCRLPGWEEETRKRGRLEHHMTNGFDI